MNRGGDTVGVQRVHLVLHQGNQWRDYQGDAVKDEGRQLVAEGLAAACGHQRQAVPPAQDVAYYFFLAGPESCRIRSGFEDSKRDGGTVHGSANLSLLDSSLGRGRETRVILFLTSVGVDLNQCIRRPLATRKLGCSSS